MNQDTIFVFDLDGVITNPTDSSVDMVTVEHIYKLLQNNTLVAINTGRSYEWVKANLLHAFDSMAGETNFDHLYIVCEKGGESLVWQNDDFSPQPSRFALSNENIAKCRQIFNDNVSTLSTMFWDATKLTMATIEKLPNADLNEFHQQQIVLADKLKEAFSGADVKVDATTVATDVEFPGAGKHAGAELIYEWVAQYTNVKTASFICFGDSKSDYEMARYFASCGNGTTFVFVGKKDDVLSEHDNVQLIRTEGLYSAGTREYFASIR